MASTLLSPTTYFPLTSNSSKQFKSFTHNPNQFLCIPILHRNLRSKNPCPASTLIKFSYNESTESSSNQQQGNNKAETVVEEDVHADTEESSRFNVEIASPSRLSLLQATPRLSLSDQAFFLLSFIACTTSVAFASLVVAAVPTLWAMGRAATSLSKLADTAREELPSTMAAVRLSGMEISDLTLELNDLSQEIAEGVSKSAQAVQVAEAGIRQIGTRARQQTMSMIQERASLPIMSLQPAVAVAAKKTSNAVGRATKNLIYFISRGEFSSTSEDDGADRLEH